MGEGPPDIPNVKNQPYFTLERFHQNTHRKLITQPRLIHKMELTEKLSKMSLIDSLTAFPEPQIKDALLEQYKDKDVNALPTPALLIKKSVIEDNCKRLLNRVSQSDFKFRAHVKTHKTIEITRKQLGYDLPDYEGPQYDSVVVSTLKEAYSIINYQEKTGNNIINDIVYGIPNITEDTLLRAVELRKKVKHFRLLIDNAEHIKLLKQFSIDHKIEKPWSVFVKLDAGTARAGIHDPQLLSHVLSELLTCPYLEFYGFYVHAGHSYSANTVEESEKHFLEEIESVSDAMVLLENTAPELDPKKVCVSVGATPTLHSLEHTLYTQTSKNIETVLSRLKATVEVHAGNYGICDLQQVSTGCVKEQNVAMNVLSTVISQYPKRKHPVGELLTNTGVIALSREPARKYQGFGKVITNPKYGDWSVNRVSQEHGILRPSDSDPAGAKLIPIGTKIRIIPNHACITANSYNAYYVLDDEDKIVDVYIPWRGW